jgi:aspartate/methionine/tyrosine aminotransferase
VLETRHELFRKKLPKSWKIGAQGGYYAFVRHPFVGIDSRTVSQRLAEQIGVITLPSVFFSDGVEPDRWIRFSVANVDDEKVLKVCERLAETENTFEWDVE